MKIYIYRDIFNDFSAFHQEAYDKNFHNLRTHLKWFNDLNETLVKYEVKDPNEADYFYIPICTLVFEFLNIDISPIIKKLEFIGQGRHILFVSGDYSHREKGTQECILPSRKYSKIYDWLDPQFILISVESTPSLLSTDIAIFPYQNEKIQLKRNLLYVNSANSSYSNKEPSRMESKLLYSFCGALSYGDHLPEGHIRGFGGIINYAKTEPDCFIGSQQDALRAFGYVDSTYHSIMSRSTFTLCPAGYGRWSFRWIEALLCKSIPIIMSDGYTLPFGGYINWSKYVIILKEDSLKSVDSILREISPSEISSMQANIARDQHLFTKQNCHNLIVSELERLTQF
jgi:hypothetical protein